MSRRGRPRKHSKDPTTLEDRGQLHGPNVYQLYRKADLLGGKAYIDAAGKARLELPDGVTGDMDASTIGILRAHGHLEDHQYQAGWDLRRLYMKLGPLEAPVRRYTDFLAREPGEQEDGPDRRIRPNVARVLEDLAAITTAAQYAQVRKVVIDDRVPNWFRREKLNSSIDDSTRDTLKHGLDALAGLLGIKKVA